MSEENGGSEEAVKPGSLRVWWIPQVPGKPFYVPVKSVSEGAKIMQVLAAYDAFQFQNNIKPDYCNSGGLMEQDDEFGWTDWIDEATGESDPFLYLDEDDSDDG